MNNFCWGCVTIKVGGLKKVIEKLADSSGITLIDDFFLMKFSP